MDKHNELHAEVKTAIQKIRNRGDKATASHVAAEVGRNRKKTLDTYNLIMDEEAKKKERTGS